MRKLLENIADLINVKTAVTFAVVYVFVRLALDGKFPLDFIIAIVTMVISFYFGTVYQKNSDKKKTTKSVTKNSNRPEMEEENDDQDE